MKPSKSSPKEPKPHESEQNSLNIDDNYNEEEGLQQNKIQKLSIMDDFNQLCHKLNQPLVQSIAETPVQNTLAHYYAKLKQKNQSPQEHKKDTNNTNVIANHSQKASKNDMVIQKISKPSPVQTHHVRSSSSNIPNNPQPNNPLQAIKHQRNPSQGEAFKKKIIQEMEMNDSKRNYSSVEEKKRILQPSKNALNTHQNLSMKDYYGEQKSIILKKQTIKNMVPKEPKHLKQTILNSYPTQSKQTHSHKFNKQNNLKQSNMINQAKKVQPTQTQKASKVTIQKNTEKNHRPQIVLFSKRINLNEDPKILEAMLKEAQMGNQADMSNVSVSSIDQGLFGNAIEKQRNAKTSQTVQSPQIHINLLPPSRKEQIIHNPKQYISSPINITHSPNPTNAPKSIFQKRQIYRC